MAKNRLRPFVVIAWLSLANPNYAETQTKTLTPEVTQLDWDGWSVKIDALKFSSVVEHYGTEKAGPDSIFVCLNLTVKNDSNHGKSFIPQNALKIVIGGKEYDAQDLDKSVSYMNNIEPTLVRNRLCYFELPTSQVGDSFTIRFNYLFSEEKTVKVTITNPPPPAPTPTPEIEVTTRQNEREQQWVESETNQKIVSTPTPIPFRMTIESADADLTYAWQSLTSQQRDRLGQEERNWMRHRDSLPVEARIKSTAERAKYIWSFVERTFDD
jgi:hypothetical protein